MVKPTKDVAISALEKYLQSKLGNNLDNGAQIAEKQADQLLNPVLIKYANQIQSRNFKGEDWKNAKEKIETN